MSKETYTRKKLSSDAGTGCLLTTYLHIINYEESKYVLSRAMLCRRDIR
jgi:hypothetical protein